MKNEIYIYIYTPDGEIIKQEYNADSLFDVLYKAIIGLMVEVKKEREQVEENI